MKTFMKILNNHGRYHLHDPIITIVGFIKIIYEALSTNKSNQGVSRTLSDLYGGAFL